VIGIAVASVFSFGRAAGNLFSFKINFGGEKGSGSVRTEKRNVSGFKAIKAGGVFIVEVTAQKETSVEVEADDNLLPFITTESDGETLKIETIEKFSTRSPIRLRISAPDIENLEISGASKISVVNLANDSLRVESNGASKINVEGATKNLTVEMSGASRFDAGNLRAETVSIEAGGASKATVSVIASLKADLSGASKVVYYGSPANLEKKTSGASSVIGR
jgi:hypothetical protein